MFWRKRKPKFDDARKQVFAENIAGMLSCQLVMTGKPTIDDDSGEPNMKALGYVYGFIDGALRVIGQDMADGEVGIPITFMVLRQVWPDRADAYLETLTDNLHNPTVGYGMARGGQQYIDFWNDKMGPPTGLAKIMIESGEPPSS